ncbi:ANKRD44 [Mytilus edulis]|uniref:ANKRD44 n=1 Tax=Mytilus edulis TaxID=6550 RepID=A0A8S3SDL3_MYTED|nr:ANKRD44 [Mytilus edulis]
MADELLDNSEVTMVTNLKDKNEVTQVVRMIIQNGADVNKQNENGDTALHLAISADVDIDVLRILIKRGSSLKINNNNGKTPLECLNRGSWQTAVNLLKLEKHFDFRNSRKETLRHLLMNKLGSNIWTAIDEEEQDEQIGLFWANILKEIDQFNIDLNCQDKFGFTPLHNAAEFAGSSKHLEVMFSHFSNINPFLVDVNGNTFLHIYVTRLGVFGGSDLDDRLFRGELLFLPKSSLKRLMNIQNSNLDSPLHLFIRGLVDLEIDINEEMSENSFEIDMEDKLSAKSYEDEEMKDSNLILLDLVVDINLKNKLGHTPLLTLLRKPQIDLEIIKTFLNKGADIHAVDVHVEFEEEAKLIKSVVLEIVTNILKQISETNKYLKSTIVIQTGSVGEGTKVGIPNEFDFVCIFDKLSEICYVDEEKSAKDPGYAYLKLKDAF